MKDPFELNAKSIMALYELFPTEEACIKHLEANFNMVGVSSTVWL